MTDLREIERESIRAFVQSAADEGYLRGAVLDYGAGSQPYRDIVPGHYFAHDDPAYPAHVPGGDPRYAADPYPLAKRWDAILCTQVVQYVQHDRVGRGNPFVGVHSLLADFEIALEEGGHLVLTYPTNWPEVEPEDLHRFTKAGMERLLIETGFTIIRHEPRAVAVAEHGGLHGTDVFNRLEGGPEFFALGYGVICRA